MARPRSVPEEEALHRALLLFWTKGYDRTSISDLGHAIGVGPSSIYNAFGSKAEFFERALDLYVEAYTSFVRDAIDQVGELGAEGAIRKLMREAALLYTTPGLPPGCAMLQGGGAGGSEDSEGGAIARKARGALEAALRKLLRSAPDSDRLTSPTPVLARFLLGVMRGLAQLACDGASRRQLLQVAEHAAATCVATREQLHRVDQTARTGQPDHELIP